jgi:hypothetical protein
LLSSNAKPFEVSLDLVSNALLLDSSGGNQRTVEFSAARPIADIWRDFNAALSELGIPAHMWDKPQGCRALLRSPIGAKPFVT